MGAFVDNNPASSADSASAITPEQLAKQCQAGCRDSFEMLVTYFEERIFHYLLKLVGNHHDAEDIAQETFVKAYRHIESWNPQYAFSTWLFTIAKRTAANHYRSKKIMEPLDEESSATQPTPSEQLESKDESGSIWRAARSLKPSQYEVLWLSYGEGFSIAETAKIMNTNQLRVRVLLHRARNLLTKKLSRNGQMLYSE